MYVGIIDVKVKVNIMNSGPKQNAAWHLICATIKILWRRKQTLLPFIRPYQKISVTGNGSKILLLYCNRLLLPPWQETVGNLSFLQTPAIRDCALCMQGLFKPRDQNKPHLCLFVLDNLATCTSFPHLEALWGISRCLFITGESQGSLLRNPALISGVLPARKESLHSPLTQTCPQNL